MARKPINLLLVFADQMRSQSMRHIGNQDIRTPNMDRLAAEGVSFKNAVANCPVCAPSRGSMLTGVRVLRHHAVSNDVPIRTDLPTMATLLRDASCVTGYIGKWHLDGMPRDRFTPPGPRRLGFDDFWAVWNCHHEYFDGRYYADTPQVRRLEGYEPHGQTDMAIQFIEQHRKDPFALVLSWGPPHGPLELVPDEYRQMYDPTGITLRPNVPPSETERGTLEVAVPPWNPTDECRTRFDGDVERRIRESIATYYAAVTALDENLGRLLGALDRLGLSENTLVVFTSDHGSMLWSHGRIRKQQPWEETILVPLIIRAPGRLPSGHVTSVLAGLVDLTPTVLDLMGQAVPDGMDGVSVVSSVLGREPPPRSVLFGIPVPVDGVVEEGVDRGWRGVRTERYTYARWQDGRGWVLYDNQADPYQLHNLIDHPDAGGLRSEMESELQRQLERNNDEFLPWQRHVVQCGVVDEWNLRERIFYPDGGRQVTIEEGQADV